MSDLLAPLFAGLALWQVTLVVLGLSLALAVAFEFVLIKVARHAVERTESTYDNIVLEEVRWPIVITAALGGVWLLTSSPSAQTEIIGQEQLSVFFGKPSLSVIVVVWAWALNQIVNRVVEVVKDKGSRFDFAPVFSNVWTLVMTAASLFALLTLWGIEITPLLGAAGIAGIAVGFAAKDTVANFFGGLALYFDDTYKIGDFVVLDNGDAGTVVRVGIRSTTLQTRDETLVTVPNSVLNATKITNYSAPQRRKRIRVPIGIAYGTDVDAFEELAVQAAIDEDLVLDSPKPRMRFRQFGTDALEYELLAWVRSPNRERRAQHELNRTLYKRLQAAGMEIPFQQRDIHVRSTAAIPGEDVGRAVAEDGGVDDLAGDDLAGDDR
jgi:MscS family membrane protein